MTFSGGFLNSWIFSAIGWALLHFVWQGTVVAFLLRCALRVLATGSAQLRYLTACTALVITLFLPVATFVHLVSVHDAYAKHHHTPTAVEAVAGGVITAVDMPAWTVQLGESLDVITPWIFLVWFTGAVLFLCRLQVGVLIVRRMKALETSPVESELLRIFERAQKRLAVSRPVQLLHSALVQVPTVVGWLRPVVLIPIGSLSGLSPEQIEAILCHELAHIVRHDCLVGFLQSMLEGLLFYHPAVWWISGQVRLERECCCDELVVSIGADVAVYARALFNLATRQSSYPELASAANGGILTMRIKRLVEYRSGASESRAGVLLMLLTIALAAGIASSFAQAESRDPEKGALESPSARLQSMTSLKGDPSTGANIPVEIKTTTLAYSLRKSISPIYEPAPRTIALASIDAQPAEIAANVEPVLPPEPAHVSSGVMAGNKISGPTPVYPPDAKAKHISGSVVLNALISEEGSVDQLTVVSGPSELRDSALTAVKQWKYKPYLLNGTPTAVQTVITVTYSFGK
jgi:TonB family protein